MAEAVCWADPGGTVPKAALSLLFSAGQGEKTKWEAWGGRSEQGETPDQCLSQAKQTWLGEINFIDNKSQ